MGKGQGKPIISSCNVPTHPPHPHPPPPPKPHKIPECKKGELGIFQPAFEGREPGWEGSNARGRGQQPTRQVQRARPTAPLRKSGAGEQRNSGVGGPGGRGGKAAEPTPRGGRALHSHGCGRRPPSPRAGAHTQLAVFPGRNIHSQEDRSSFFAAVAKATESGPDLGEGAGPDSGGCPGGRAAPPPVEPALLACLGRGFARRCTDLSLAGEARTASSLRGPALLFLMFPPPRAPRTGSRPTRTRRGRQGQARGAWRARPSVRWGSSPSVGVAFAAPPAAPSLLLLSSQCDSFQREGDGGTQTDK